MKKIIGIIITVLVLALIAILVLRMWDVQVVSLETLIKSSATVIILGVTIVILIILYGFFFRSDRQDYNRKSGKRAHPKA